MVQPLSRLPSLVQHDSQSLQMITSLKWWWRWLWWCIWTAKLLLLRCCCHSLPSLCPSRLSLYSYFILSLYRTVSHVSHHSLSLFTYVATSNLPEHFEFLSSLCTDKYSSLRCNGNQQKASTILKMSIIIILHNNHAEKLLKNTLKKHVYQIIR